MDGRDDKPEDADTYAYAIGTVCIVDIGCLETGMLVNLNIIVSIEGLEDFLIGQRTVRSGECSRYVGKGLVDGIPPVVLVVLHALVDVVHDI